jgi:hypothetical protein
MWAKNWLLGRDRFTHLNLLNFNRNDSPEDYKNYFRMSDEYLTYVLAKVKPLIVKQDTVTKLTLSVRVAVWIREPGSRPPTHVRANCEPSPTEGPGEPGSWRPTHGRVWLIGTRAGLASQTPTCMSTLRHRRS